MNQEMLYYEVDAQWSFYLLLPARTTIIPLHTPVHRRKSNTVLSIPEIATEAFSVARLNPSLSGPAADNGAQKQVLHAVAQRLEKGYKYFLKEATVTVTASPNRSAAGSNSRLG
uniref:hypothetical protein n=1 Tax=Scandinavium goeteborgense TaxID=1851514 RepID=UPI001358AABD|nr:hypothetical protein [Scandinavium goeteborgense]